MSEFTIVNDFNDIQLPIEWRDSSTSKFVDRNGNQISLDYQGHRYQILKKVRDFSCPEKFARRFLGVLVLIVTLGIAYFKFETVRNLILKTKETKRYGLLVVEKNDIPSTAGKLIDISKQSLPTTKNIENKSIPSPKPVEEIPSNDIPSSVGKHIDISKQNLPIAQDIENKSIPSPKPVEEIPSNDIPSPVGKLIDISKQGLPIAQDIENKTVPGLKPAEEIPSEVKRVLQIQIYIKTFMGFNQKLTVNSNITIRDLKKILDPTYPNELSLFFAARQLVDTQTLAEYGIQNESIICCMRNLRVRAEETPSEVKRVPQIQIYIKTLADFNSTLTVDSNITIKDLKKILDPKYPNKLILLFARRQLEDTQTLAEYGIQNESTICCLQNLRGD